MTAVTVYYAGSEAQFKAITGYAYMLGANIVYAV